MNAEKIFKQTEKLLYHQSWYYSRRYGIDFEDVKSQAFLVFCEALDRPYTASFPTFLFHRLRTLNDYCKKEKKIMGSYTELQPDRSSRETNVNERLAFYESLEQLSTDGRRVAKAIIDGHFERPEMKRQRAISKYRIKEVVTKDWNWSGGRVDQVWDELRRWWENRN